MSRASQLASAIERTVSGPMWHGPALTDLLDGVPHERAAAHPIAGAHSIWEIGRHVTARAGTARRRIGGEKIDPPPEQDWPPVQDQAGDAWARAVEQMAAR